MTGAVRDVCADVLDTPISPELLPAVEGEMTQRTEEIVGDYALHDFSSTTSWIPAADLRGSSALPCRRLTACIPRKRSTAQLREFIRRFFSQQFKRNCVPDGPKVGSVSLSPRGDWRMPSDMSDSLMEGYRDG